MAAGSRFPLTSSQHTPDEMLQTHNRRPTFNDRAVFASEVGPLCLLGDRRPQGVHA